MESSSRSYIRFIPHAWDQPGNTHGNAWAGTNRTVIFEMNLTGRRPNLYVISGKAPDAWIDPLWERSGSAPFRRPRRNARPRMWCTLHAASQSKISLSEDDSEDPNDIAQKIYDWCISSYQAADSQEVISIIAAELPRLQKESGAE
jgi:hypothetical protein